MIHPHPTLADGSALVGRVSVLPDWVAGARVECPHVIDRSEIDNAVYREGRSLDAGSLLRLKGPRKAELMHICRSDLREWAVASSRVISVIAGPAIRRRVQKHRARCTLGHQPIA